MLKINFYKVFNPQIQINTGVRLVLQQLRALFLKRFRVFYHRYLLASIILLGPIILECLFCLVIPSQTYLIGEGDGSDVVAVRFSDDYKLGLDSYGPFRMPYYINGSTYSQLPMRNLISKFYGRSARTQQLVELGSPNVSGYVMEERLRSLSLLVDDYYVAMNLNLTTSERFFSTIYYSSLAFHSSSNVLHEWSNLFLSFLINNPGVI